MKVFLSASRDCGQTELAEETLRAAGCEPLSGDTRSLQAAEALLVLLSGTDHARVKADLNLALNRGLPVAAVRFPDAETDRGLDMQLGLANALGPDHWQRDLGRWIDRLRTARSSRRKKKTAGAIAAVIAVLLLGMAAALLLPKLLSPGQGSGEAPLPTSSAGTEDEIFGGEDPAEITVLDLSGRGLTDVSFLTKAVNLRELDLSDNEITDLTPLAGLTKLEKLSLRNNRVTDVTILLALTALRELDLRDNPLEDRTALDFMPDVTVLE